MVRTHRGGYCAVGNNLSVQNGASREVRGYILDREQAAAELRKQWRRKPKKVREFVEYKPEPHLLYPETRGF